MTANYRTALQGMYISVTATQYLMAWAAYTAYKEHATQTYDTVHGKQHYASAHLEVVANSAYTQAQFDKKLIRFIQAHSKLNEDEIVAIITTTALLHDLKEDTQLKQLSDLIDSLDQFEAEPVHTLAASNGLVKDNTIFAFPSNFTGHKALREDVVRYLPVIDTALSHLTKKEGEAYNDYRERLLQYKAESLFQKVAWIIALVVKLHDSQHNFQSCINTGKYSWSKKYLTNITDIVNTLDTLLK